MTEQAICRGDIYYTYSASTIGSENDKARPAIIVSNDVNNRHSSVVEVVYLTSSHRKKPLPTHVPIRTALCPSVALCEQVDSVSTLRLENLIGHCTEQEMAAVDEALKISLGLVPSWRDKIN